MVLTQSPPSLGSLTTGDCAVASATSTGAIVALRKALRAGLDTAGLLGDAVDLLEAIESTVLAAETAFAFGVVTETAAGALLAGDFGRGECLATGRADPLGDSELVARGPARSF